MNLKRNLFQELEDAEWIHDRIDLLINHLKENLQKYDHETILKLLLLYCENDNSKDNDLSSLTNYFKEEANDYQSIFYAGLALYYKSKPLIRENEYKIDLCKKAINLFERYKDKNEDENINYFLGKAYYNLGTLVEKNEEFTKALTYFQKYEEELEYNYRFNNAIGDVYYKLKNYAIAKEKYILSKYYSEGTYAALPINGLGNILMDQGKYEEAIQKYEESIKTRPNFVCPIHYIGECYRILEEYDLARKYFDKVLQINAKYIHSIYGIGRIFYELGNRTHDDRNYEKAEKYFLDALKIKPDYFYANKDLARVYEKQYKFDEAERTLEKCYKYPVQTDIKEILNQIQKNKHILNNKNKLMNDYPLENRPIYQIICSNVFDEREKQIFNRTESFEISFLRADHRRKRDNSYYIDLLKRWNSYTPIIQDNSKGGGYFLNIKDIGIVIDPGFDFINNFKLQKHIFADIDYIFITHSHDDHTADLESIINLTYRYNERLKNIIIVRDIAKRSKISTEHVSNIVQKFNDLTKRLNKSDEELLKFLSDSVEEQKKYPEIEIPIIDQLITEFKNKKKVLDLYISQGVYNKFSGLFKNDELCIELELDQDFTKEDSKYYKTNYTIRKLTPDTVINLPNKTTIATINGKHKDKLDPEGITYGFLIDIDSIQTTIIYTGDTGWCEDIVKNNYANIFNKFPKISEKYLLLIAHIGSFKESEREYTNYEKNRQRIHNSNLCENENKKSNNTCPFYKYHLGRIGLARLVEEVNPKLCLISEFGEEFEGLRIHVTDSFNKAFEKLGPFFLPADIGLRFDLIKQKIRVISQINHEQHWIVYEYISPKNVNVVESQKHNCLLYLKNEKVVTDALIAIYENYQIKPDHITPEIMI